MRRDGVNEDGTCTWYSFFTKSGHGVRFNSEGTFLVEEWRHTPGARDGQLSGVIADWMKDNYDLLMSLGNESVDVDEVTERLMERSRDPIHNYSGEKHHDD